MAITVASLRKIRNESYYDVVFEWEDEMAGIFGSKVDCGSVPFFYLCRAYGKLYKGYRAHQDLSRAQKICFIMSPLQVKCFSLQNVIPVFMDVWSDEHVNFIVDKTRDLKLFYCTSMEIYDRIKRKDANSRVRYMPLSVSDVYYSENFAAYAGGKSSRVIQIGRKNPVLHQYMLQYVKEHPQVEYIYTTDVRHKDLFEYVSSLRGNIGTITDRKEYIGKLSGAKVSLVSTPAMDGSRKYANGNDFLTPRFYESAVLGCAMIGRYAVNKETEKIAQICPNITSYEQFVQEMDKALVITPEELFAKEKDFIQSNLTSCRARQIESDIRDILGNPDGHGF